MGCPRDNAFSVRGGPRRSDLVETLDSYVSSPFAMGIISKSVAHACSGGARGFFKPNDQEYGEAAGVVKFHRDQEKPGRYVSEFRGPARVSCKHAHRAAQPRKAAQALLRSRDLWVRTLKLYPSNACETVRVPYCRKATPPHSRPRGQIKSIIFITSPQIRAVSTGYVYTRSTY